MSDNKLLILPTLKTCGGVLEALKFLSSLDDTQTSKVVVAMWKTENEVEIDSNIKLIYLSNYTSNKFLALFQLPLIIFNFYLKVVRKHLKLQNSIVFLTHYTTLFFLFFIPYNRRFLLLQGLEWKFLDNTIFSSSFSLLIISIYNKIQLISFSPVITKNLKIIGLKEFGRFYIWADNIFSIPPKTLPKYDIVFMIRQGFSKRPDLTMTCIDEITKERPSLKLALISPDKDYYNWGINKKISSFLLPSKKEMAEIYSSSKVFLYLSETEGFGLPPLEAMASGCVPICRDSGGPKIYLKEKLSDLLLPLDLPSNEIIKKAFTILDDKELWSKYSKESRLSFMSGANLNNDNIKELTNRIYNSVNNSS